MKEKGSRTLVQSLFDVNHPTWQLVERLFDLMFLNLLTVFASLPILTVGLAKIALQSCLWEMEAEGKIKIWSTYWSYFRRQWRRDLSLSLIESGITTFCLLDLYLVWGQVGFLFDGFRALCIAILLFSQLLWVYLYPLASRYSFPLKDLFLQAVLHMGSLLALTVKVGLTYLLVVAFLLYSDLTLLIGIVCLLSFAYAGLSFLFIKELGSNIS